MAKLSVEIPAERDVLAEASVRIEGSDAELLCCLGYLAHAVASDMGIPVPALLGIVAAGSPKIQDSILESYIIDQGAIETAMEGGQGK